MPHARTAQNALEGVNRMVLPPPQTREFNERILELEEECREELEVSMQSLNEIALLLNKTNSEVEKLAHREVQMANRVREMELHLDNYGREDIRDLYNTSHEIQLRLFMMRSQAEQLQNRQSHVKEYQVKLRLLIDLISIHAVGFSEPGNDSMSTSTPRGGTGVLLPAQSINQPNLLNIIEAQEDERFRISQQIHDGPTQALANLILRAEICERLIDRDVDEARSELSSLKAMIGASLQDTRRLSFDLRPMILDDLGLVPTLRRYMTEIGRLKEMQSIVSGPEHEIRMNTTMQVAVFRMVQTIISAILAEGAAEHLDVHIEREATVARVRLEATSLQTDREIIEERLEEQGFQDRLVLLNAVLKTEPRSNRGITVEILLPIPEEAAA
jgi:two-component system sensor histidine kinase DegS